MHQNWENRLSQIRATLQDLLAAQLQRGLMQNRQREQIQQRIELLLLAELFQSDPDRSLPPGRKVCAAKSRTLRRRLRCMAVLADQSLCLGRWRTSKQAFHT
ncbi:MAG: hypothetical protein KFB97_13255 [Cyanobium sp. M30B3]|nr:MAG: hypothetical protein KFB97_13255 [Cyanobium sp. M30B3]